MAKKMSSTMVRHHDPDFLRGDRRLLLRSSPDLPLGGFPIWKGMVKIICDGEGKGGQYSSRAKEREVQSEAEAISEENGEG